MLKNPFDKFKLCVGGSGEAGFSSGGAEADPNYSKTPDQQAADAAAKQYTSEQDAYNAAEVQKVYNSPDAVFHRNIDAQYASLAQQQRTESQANANSVLAKQEEYRVRSSMGLSTQGTADELRYAQAKSGDITRYYAAQMASLGVISQQHVVQMHNAGIIPQSSTPNYSGTTSEKAAAEAQERAFQATSPAFAGAVLSGYAKNLIVGTPSPSDTGNVWSGSGWISKSNITPEQNIYQQMYAPVNIPSGGSHTVNFVATPVYIPSVNGGVGTEKFATIYNPKTGNYEANDAYQGIAYTSLGLNNQTQGVPTGAPGNIGQQTPGGANQIFNEISHGGGAVNPGVIGLAMGQGNQLANQKYGAQPNTAPVVGGAAYDMVTEMTKAGQIIDPTLYAKAVSQGYGGQAGVDSLQKVNLMAGRSTEPVRDLSSGLTGIPSYAAAGSTLTAYVPYGAYTQTELKNVKLAMDYNTGELAIYQQPYGHSMYNLVGGGSRASLQSGMFSVNEPMTPFVTTQWGVGDYGMPNGTNLSKLGSEAYGGFVLPLDSRTLTPESQMSVYSNKNNLANYVNPEGANLGKSQAPGAKIPWSTKIGAPPAQYMDEEGFTGRVVGLPAGTSTMIESPSASLSSPVQDVKGSFIPVSDMGVLENGVNTAQVKASMEAAGYTTNVIPSTKEVLPTRGEIESITPLPNIFPDQEFTNYAIEYWGPVAGSALALTYSSFSGHWTPEKRELITEKAQTVEYTSLPKTGGVDYSRTYIGADNKPTQEMTFPEGKPYMKEGVEYQNYITSDLSKVTIKPQYIVTTTPSEGRFESGEKVFADWVSKRVIPEAKISAEGTPSDIIGGFQNYVREKPLTLAKDVGVFTAIAAGFMIAAPIAGGYAGSVAAGKGIASPVARAAIWAGERHAVPIVFAGLVGYEGVSETTAGFTDYSAKGYERFGRFSASTLLPMAISGGIVYGAVRVATPRITDVGAPAPNGGNPPGNPRNTRTPAQIANDPYDPYGGYNPVRYEKMQAVAAKGRDVTAFGDVSAPPNRPAYSKITGDPFNYENFSTEGALPKVGIVKPSNVPVNIEVPKTPYEMGTKGELPNVRSTPRTLPDMLDGGIRPASPTVSGTKGVTVSPQPISGVAVEPTAGMPKVSYPGTGFSGTDAGNVPSTVKNIPGNVEFWGTSQTISEAEIVAKLKVTSGYGVFEANIGLPGIESNAPTVIKQFAPHFKVLKEVGAKYGYDVGDPIYPKGHADSPFVTVSKSSGKTQMINRGNGNGWETYVGEVLPEVGVRNSGVRVLTDTTVSLPDRTIARVATAEDIARVNAHYKSGGHGQGNFLDAYGTQTQQITRLTPEEFQGQNPKILEWLSKENPGKYGDIEKAYVYDTRTGEKEVTVYGHVGGVSNLAATNALSKAYPGKSLGVIHIHTESPNIISFTNDLYNQVATKQMTVRESIPWLIDYIKNPVLYKSGGGHPSGADLIAAQYRKQLYPEHRVVEEGVLSSEGVSMYFRKGGLLPLEEIYPNKATQEASSINLRIDNEELFDVYSSGRKGIVPETQAVGKKLPSAEPTDIMPVYEVHPGGGIYGKFSRSTVTKPVEFLDALPVIAPGRGMASATQDSGVGLTQTQKLLKTAEHYNLYEKNEIPSDKSPLALQSQTPSGIPRGFEKWNGITFGSGGSGESGGTAVKSIATSKPTKPSKTEIEKIRLPNTEVAARSVEGVTRRVSAPPTFESTPASGSASTNEVIYNAARPVESSKSKPKYAVGDYDAKYLEQSTASVVGETAAIGLPITGRLSKNLYGSRATPTAESISNPSPETGARSDITPKSISDSFSRANVLSLSDVNSRTDATAKTMTQSLSESGGYTKPLTKMGVGTLGMVIPTARVTGITEPSPAIKTVAEVGVKPFALTTPTPITTPTSRITTQPVTRIEPNPTPKPEPIPKPIIPVLPPFPFPNLGGGGGGSGGSLKRKGPRKTEWFSYAPSNLNGLMGMPAKKSGKYLINKETKYHW